VVGALSNGKDVGRDLIPPLAAVQLHRPRRVDGEPLVRVHGDTEEAGVRLYRIIKNQYIKYTVWPDQISLKMVPLDSLA
jgi:hypothetical protein